MTPPFTCILLTVSLLLMTACTGQAQQPAVPVETPDLEGQVPGKVKKLANDTRAFLYFPLERLLILWGHHGSDWRVVGIQALDWCEDSPVEDLIGKGSKVNHEEESASASASDLGEQDALRSYLRRFAELYNRHDFAGLDALNGGKKPVAAAIFYGTTSG